MVHLLAVNMAEEIETIEMAVTEKIVLEENIERTKAIEAVATDRREIDLTGIDHPFVATATVLHTEVTTAVAIDLLTEAAATEIVPKATAHLTVETVIDLKETVPPIAAAAAEIDHPIEVVVETDQVAAAGLDPAVAVDVLAVAEDFVPAVVVEEDLHSEVLAEIAPLEEIKIKPLKKARTTKTKQSF
jgi:hypothetical protein